MSVIYLFQYNIFTGDYVLNHFKENHVYATDTNASVTVAYPKYEPGNLVTCVELKVFQVKRDWY